MNSISIHDTKRDTSVETLQKTTIERSQTDSELDINVDLYSASETQPRDLTNLIAA